MSNVIDIQAFVKKTRPELSQSPDLINEMEWFMVFRNNKQIPPPQNVFVTVALKNNPKENRKNAVIEAYWDNKIKRLITPFHRAYELEEALAWAFRPKYPERLIK